MARDCDCKQCVEENRRIALVFDDDELDEIFGNDLQGGAARAAAAYLAHNWVDAMQEGAQPRDLANDVNEVLEILANFRDRVKLRPQR